MLEDGLHRLTGIHNVNDLIPLVHLVLDSGFNGREVIQILHLDNHLVVIVAIICLVEPVLRHDYCGIGADIKGHPALLDDAGNPQGTFISLSTDCNPGSDLDVVVCREC